MEVRISKASKSCCMQKHFRVWMVKQLFVLSIGEGKLSVSKAQR